MNNRQLEDETNNFVLKGCVFVIMLGSLGLIKLFQKPEVRADALLHNNKKSLLTYLYNFQGTAGRLEYILIQCISGVFYLLISGFLNENNSSGLAIIFSLITLPLIPIAFAVIVRRCRDLSLSPWILLLLPIPVIGVIVVLTFMLFPGGYRI